LSHKKYLEALDEKDKPAIERCLNCKNENSEVYKALQSESKTQKLIEPRAKKDDENSSDSEKEGINSESDAKLTEIPEQK
jgi:hypothetical protein